MGDPACSASSVTRPIITFSRFWMTGRSSVSVVRPAGNCALALRNPPPTGSENVALTVGPGELMAGSGNVGPLRQGSTFQRRFPIVSRPGFPLHETNRQFGKMERYWLSCRNRATVLMLVNSNLNLVYTPLYSGSPS
jgi:hypothetical protein